MTLDESDDWDQLNDLFIKRAIWEYRFVIFPKRCARSNKLLWLEKHWRLRVRWAGLTEVFYQQCWLHRDVGTHIKLRYAN